MVTLFYYEYFFFEIAFKTSYIYNIENVSIVAGSMTALPSASSGVMVGEYDMSSRGHSYDFATATLSSEDVNVRIYSL